MPDISHKSGIYGFDKAPHPFLKCTGMGYSIGVALPALCRMFGRAAFGQVDHRACKQCSLCRIQLHAVSKFLKVAKGSIIQMGL